MKANSVNNNKKLSSNFSPFGGVRGGFFIIKTFTHYFKQNLLVALGVVVSTAVLTGALIIGDSVRYSLEQSTFSRLGETTHLVSVTERYFRQEMAAEIEATNPEIKATSVLLLEGVAVADGGETRVNRVQVIGVDTDFEEISNNPLFSELQDNEIAISQNLAERLQIKEGYDLLVRIKKASLIPMNAPFVSAEETSVSLRATVKKVVSKDELGRFNLKNSQTAPYNIFLSAKRLNRLMEFAGKANQILISTIVETAKVAEIVKKCITPTDAGLQLKNIKTTNQTEISTERVFLEEKIAETIQKLDGAEPMLTYFVNEIEASPNLQMNRDKLPKGGKKPPLTPPKEGNRKLETLNPEPKTKSIPYSFVSSVSNQYLSSGEIILNRWAADDLQVKPGDSIRLKYFEIGPLRQLVNKESVFILKGIIEMNSGWSDSTRVPHLPGLSNAGHCREWEAGVPIYLDAIRDIDEEYWNDYKGTPKAFVSEGAALKMWSNRFGNYSAVRFPSDKFDIEKYNQLFAQEIEPADLGMSISPIREQGVQAAQNGTDFSGLFIGLSFFLLLAGIILTVLLFRFNLESRSSQIGLFDALGFQQKQVRGFFLKEGFVIAIFGGILGLIVSVFYTSLVFKILNTLWFEIVRTDVLLINIYPATLISGLIISVLISLIAIFISVRRFQQQRTADLQKQTQTEEKSGKKLFLNGLMYTSLVVAFGFFIYQITGSKQMNPALFFISGILFLTGMLLNFRKNLFRIEAKKRVSLTQRTLVMLNLTRNKSRSLTIVTLFALGTFLVVSTGSNKLDLFANAQDKTSGTGGFLWFAETTMPVLFDINDTKKLAEEGILENFQVIQFAKLDGDDASCLNLNRISQPAVLGVDPSALAGRFSFAVKTKETGETDPWMALNQTNDDGTIPAIADQTVIQWGLGMKVGDILLYQNELGDTLRLKLIAGTAPSIFQGYVMISNQNFLKNYPTHSGTLVFLIDGKPEKQESIAEELQSVFRDYGWEMQSTSTRLVEFYSVTNTYLSIFLALGALGLILGTVGLAVILARTLLERRHEIALMQAVGFSTRPIFQIIASEYFLLLFAGVMIGLVAAVVATLPAFLSAGSDASFSTVAMVTGLILLNGFLWIFGLTWFSLQKKTVVTGLRVE